VHTAPGGDLTQIRPRADRDVSVDVHPAQVRVVGVAPVNMSRRPRSASSAMTGSSVMPTAPRLPGRAPRACSISSGRAGEASSPRWRR